VHLALGDLEVDVVVGDHAGVAAGDPAALDRQGLRTVRPGAGGLRRATLGSGVRLIGSSHDSAPWKKAGEPDRALPGP
jgi:hypothetical protein